MAKAQLNVRVQPELKDAFDSYCDSKGLKKERVLEALLYGFIELSKPSGHEVLNMLERLANQGGGSKQIPLSGEFLARSNATARSILAQTEGNTTKPSPTARHKEDDQAAGTAPRGQKKR
jgi:hypothetical protein